MTKQPQHFIWVVPPDRFLTKLIRGIIIGLIFIILALLIGMFGYHHYEKMTWVDSFANASMILSGMGPLTPLNTNGGKIFAGLYALFSGLLFIAIIGIIFAPVIHRFFHRLNIGDK